MIFPNQLVSVFGVAGHFDVWPGLSCVKLNSGVDLLYVSPVSGKVQHKGC